MDLGNTSLDLGNTSLDLGNTSLDLENTKLHQLTLDNLAQAFQVKRESPLIGLAGRLTLLQQLGKTLAAQRQRFGNNPAEPSDLLDDWMKNADLTLNAGKLLTDVLETFGSI